MLRTLTLAACFLPGVALCETAYSQPQVDVAIFSYDTTNYCPTGLQPVVFGGVICCGVPNAGTHLDPVSFIQRARVACPVGDKDCDIVPAQ